MRFEFSEIQLHSGVRFEIVGSDPQPKGSKKAFPVFNRKTRTYVHDRSGRPFVNVVEDNPKSKQWMKTVAQSFKVAKGYKQVGPLVLIVTFCLKKPKSSKNEYPIVRPDTTKLVRGVEDALNGLAWNDDSQVVEQHVRKIYGPVAHTSIAILPLTTNQEELWHGN